MKPIVFCLLAASAAFAQIPSAPNAEVQLASDGYKFTEGPASDAAGNVYFTDQPNDRILKWSVETGKTEAFLQPAGRSNGLYLDHDGNLIACADEDSQLWKIDVATKKHVVMLERFDEKLFNGPNDLWIDPAGGIYFTDPFYKRGYWQGREKPEQEKQRVFYLPKGADTPVVVEDTLVQPNGIIGTSDGKLLYVADIRAKKTYRYEITDDHQLTNRELFCEMGSDGMTLDQEGNLYLTGKGVTVFDKTGKNLGNIPIDEKWTANITFGGKDMKTLFITAMDSLYTLEMTVAGQ